MNLTIKKIALTKKLASIVGMIVLIPFFIGFILLIVESTGLYRFSEIVGYACFGPFIAYAISLFFFGGSLVGMHRDRMEAERRLSKPDEIGLKWIISFFNFFSGGILFKLFETKANIHFSDDMATGWQILLGIACAMVVGYCYYSAMKPLLSKLVQV